MSKFLETIKSQDANIYNLQYHQQRYESVLQSLGISIFKKLNNYLNPPTNGLYRCRLVYDKVNIEVEYFKYIKRDIKTLKLVFDDHIDYEKKSTSRETLDKLFKKRELCDDIIIVKNSLLTDTSIANIALYDGKKWFTPKKPLLKGTTRQRLLDNGKLFEKNIKADDIYGYKKIALLNAMIDFDIIRADSLKDVIC